MYATAPRNASPPLRRAFGAVEEFRLDHPGGGVLHAEIRIAGAVLMLGDVSEGPFTAPTALGGTSTALHVFVPAVDALVRAAVPQGAELLQPRRTSSTATAPPSSATPSATSGSSSPT
ncbi:hypothetical protein ACFC1D_11450 [Streptomyces vinaceus]|uniref:hypothetical protein n=1 Tax=Streptomyces vinaceus TaxID=1960 RepID=UPI0035DE48D8